MTVTTPFLHTLNKWFLFIQVPINESLILYNDPEMNNLSVQCFQSECLYTDKHKMWPLLLCSSITFPFIRPTRPDAVHGRLTIKKESHPVGLHETRLTGQCSDCPWRFMCLFFWVWLRFNSFFFMLLLVREGKGAAEGWDLLPGHQANHQQSKCVSVCHLFTLNTCSYSVRAGATYLSLYAR